MSTACLEGFFDCSGLNETENCTEKQKKNCQKKDTLLRSGLLVISFAIFSFLIAPQVQSTLPGRESVAYVNQSRQVNIRAGLPAVSRLDHDSAAKTVLVLGLVGSSQRN